MKKKFCNILMVFLMIFAVFGAISFNFSKTVVLAETQTTDVLQYLSFGDSIPAGVGLSGYTGKEQTPVTGSYPAIAKQTISEHTGIDAVNYAVSGFTSYDLLNTLKLVLGEEPDANFTINLTSQQIEQMNTKMQTADVLTICIGANDILGPAQNNLLGYVMNGDSSTLISALKAGIKTFSDNFPEIVLRLKKLSPNAKFMFNNIYNPYLECIYYTGSGIAIDFMGTHFTLTSGQIKEIGSLTEVFVDSDSNYSVSYISGRDDLAGVSSLNEIIENGIKNVDNCALVDVKSAFDKYYDDYSSYGILNVKLLTASSIVIKSMATAMSDISEYIDPHPSLTGHSEIFKVLKKTFKDNYALFEQVFDGGALNGYLNDVSIVENNKLVPESKILKPTKSDVSSYPIFGGYYIYGTEDKWDKAQPIVDVLKVKAKWVNLTYVEDNDGNDSTSILQQTLKTIKKVEFNIDTDQTVAWYVNDQLQQGANLNTFDFYAPSDGGKYKVGTYVVYCVVNGVKSVAHSVNVTYYTLPSVTIVMEQVSDNNLYEFSVVDGEYADPSKFTWWVTSDQYSDDVEMIEAGKYTITRRLSEGCEIFVKYDVGQEMESNRLEINPKFVVPQIVFIIGGVALGILLLVIGLVIISRRRYRDYY